MIDLKYNYKIDSQIAHDNLKRLTNQIQKLLPQREEEDNWQLSLMTINEELTGMSFVWMNAPKDLFTLICKLEGLLSLTDKEDFFLYRRTIFDCLQIIGKITTSLGE